MTQVKDKTDQQLNQALTELQGYSVKRAGEYPDRYRMVNPKGEEFGVFHMTEGLVWNEYAFPYCSDPAASLEVQAKAIEVNADLYVKNLEITVTGAPVYSVLRLKFMAQLLNATPRERAEAAYITLQGARE